MTTSIVPGAGCTPRSEPPASTPASDVSAAQPSAEPVESAPSAPDASEVALGCSPPRVGSAVPPAPAKLRFTADLDLHSEHGCSQSHESRGARGSVSLVIDPNDHATLTVHLEGSTVFGPSPGRFRQGDRDFVHTPNRTHDAWQGSVVRCDDTLHVRLTRVLSSRDQHGSWEDAALPDAAASNADLSVVCRAGTLSAFALPSDGSTIWALEGEPTERVAVLICELKEELFELQDLVLVDGALPLARSPDLVLYGSRKSFHRIARTGVRR
jgi:hypothetical protein